MFTPLEDTDQDQIEVRRTIPCHHRCLHQFNLPVETFALLNAAFVAVATILGTGILALPVKLSHSGFGPFFFTFTVCLCMQLATVILMVELLQRTHAEMGLHNKGPGGVEKGGVASETTGDTCNNGSRAMSIEFRDRTSGDGLEDTRQPEEAARNDEGESDTAATLSTPPTPPTTSTVSTQQPSIFTQFSTDMDTLGTLPQDAPKRASPDLHTMGGLFLKQSWMASIFDAAVVLHFCAAMISYNLAGPEAYGTLFQLPHYESLIIPFWVLYVSFICLGKKAITPTISCLTFFKCTLFLAVLVATGRVGEQTQLQPRDSWENVMEPYLIGTFALGGVVNTMPVTYAALPLQLHLTSRHTRHTAMRTNAVMLSRYRIAVCTGVLLCWVFNLLWCSNVLRIVPQTSQVREICLYCTCGWYS